MYKTKNKSKVLVIGLDCASPELIFDKWISHLPNLKLLIDNGISGKLKSCFPPITVPAWMCMFTGKDPGQLGIYGFRNRKNYNYEQLNIVNSNSIKQKTIWDYCSEESKESIVIGVPPTFPPKPLKGIMVSCFMTPRDSTNSVFPSEALKEINQITNNNYLHDVYNFRKQDRDILLENIYKMTGMRFKVVNDWIKNKNWNLFINVEIGLDRIQHAFWGYQDPLHFSYEKNNKYENAIRDYYIYLDKEIGEVLKNIAEDVSVLIVSDHSAKRMEGGFCINEWLIDNGYLKLNSEINSIVYLEPEMINWNETTAWAEGGYYGRLFLNVKGREPNGIVQKENIEKVILEIEKKLSSIKEINDIELEVNAYRPNELYKSLNGIPPDLFLVFNDFSIRSIGSVGTGSYFSLENDTGADGANHDMEGMFILKSKNIEPEFYGRKINAEIYDIFPTMIDLLKIKTDDYFIGKNIFTKLNSQKGIRV